MISKKEIQAMQSFLWDSAFSDTLLHLSMFALGTVIPGVILGQLYAEAVMILAAALLALAALGVSRNASHFLYQETGYQSLHDLLSAHLRGAV